MPALRALQHGARFAPQIEQIDLGFVKDPPASRAASATLERGVQIPAKHACREGMAGAGRGLT